MPVSLHLASRELVRGGEVEELVPGQPTYNKVQANTGGISVHRMSTGLLDADDLGTSPHPLP